MPVFSNNKEDIVLEAGTSTRAALATTLPLGFIIPCVWGVIVLTLGLLFPDLEIPMWLNILVLIGGLVIAGGLASVAYLKAVNTIIRVNKKDSVVWVQMGLFTLNHNYVPMQQIVDIDLRQNMLERMLNLASISMITIRRERVVVCYIDNGMEVCNKLIALTQENGGMMKPTSWIVEN